MRKKYYFDEIVRPIVNQIAKLQGYKDVWDMLDDIELMFSLLPSNMKEGEK